MKLNFQRRPQRYIKKLIFHKKEPVYNKKIGASLRETAKLVV